MPDLSSSSTLALAAELIARPSLTPEDAGCQELIAARLAQLGFAIQRLRFMEVDNLWVTHGTERPLLVFAGHTDVVPTGPLGEWATPPFQPTLRDGYLYGRGAADMKGSVAAMVIACERFITAYPHHGGTLALLLTSDEEGPALNGTVKVIEFLQNQGRAIDWCLVGEPTSQKELGDVVKNGRRGSLSAKLIVHGTQGHVAYPQLADNPIHRAAAAVSALCARTWDAGNAHFPPTTLQISNIHAGTGAGNVIPGTLEIQFNFRYSGVIGVDALRNDVETLLHSHGLNYTLEWTHSGAPFLTPSGQLLEATRAAIRDVLGIETQLSTSGGTSDGRFIAPTGAEVLELGPVNATLHQVNECVRVDDLERLADVYARLMRSLLVAHA